MEREEIASKLILRSGLMRSSPPIPPLLSTLCGTSFRCLFRRSPFTFWMWQGLDVGFCVGRFVIGLAASGWYNGEGWSEKQQEIVEFAKYFYYDGVCITSSHMNREVTRRRRKGGDLYVYIK